eukprot:10495376-Heterocapsa_arctica.AAC.1
MEAGQGWGHQPVGPEVGRGEQCRVVRFRQEGQVSREDRESLQACRGLALNYRNDRFCTYRNFINDDRSDQHQLGHSRQLGDLQVPIGRNHPR